MQILIAEDEFGTNETYRIFLEGNGHKVTVTANGEECMELYRSKEGAFDVVILDYRMPIKDGGIVLQELLEANPNQKVLIASAYSMDILNGMYLKTNKVKVMQKPFDLQDLLSTVNDLGKT
jgi:two-component system cell cycle response regulator CpdR